MVTVKDPGSAYQGGDTRPSWLARLLADRQPLVMGVLNLTPDSFSDGGQFLDPDKAIAHARRMIAEGADIVDVGAESTRPYGGAVRVSAAEELRRLAPVIAPLRALGVPVSVDTMKSGACNATATWPRSWPRTACRSSSCTTGTRSIRRSTSWPTSRHSLRDRWQSPRKPASRATVSCSIPESASARPRSRASKRSAGSAG